jgi:hypothetical protein
MHMKTPHHMCCWTLPNIATLVHADAALDMVAGGLRHAALDCHQNL